MAPRTPVVPAFCTTSAPLSTVNMALVAVYTYSRLYGGIFSVLLFAVILFLIMRMARKAKANNEQNRQASQQEKQQRRITVTIGISSIFTILLFVIPMIFWSYLANAMAGAVFDIESFQHERNYFR